MNRSFVTATAGDVGGNVVASSLVYLVPHRFLFAHTHIAIPKTLLAAEAARCHPHNPSSEVQEKAHQSAQDAKDKVERERTDKEEPPTSA